MGQPPMQFRARWVARTSSRNASTWLERVAGVVSEDGGQGPRLEPVEQPVEDRVPEVLLRPEVVIEITLSGATLPEDVVERSPMVALDGHEPGGHFEDLLLDGRGTHWAVPTGR